MYSKEHYALLGEGSSQLQESLKLNDDVRARLEVLVQTAGILGIDDVHTSSFLTAISDQSNREFALQRTLVQLKRAEDLLTEHLEEAQDHERLIQKWTKAIQNSEPSPEENVAATERRTAGLAAKAREYQRDLEKLTAEATVTSMPTISELAAERERLRKKEHELKLKRTKVEAYMGLPPNLELARFELRRAEEEHKKLIDLRERLLANMAAGVS
ncbi:hypothetical protein EIP86_005818 [Pleurotus ostreatoroseus]|nr:hypothetical protein EIP86_005818 [Pleurotus ostreatoroseus]